MCGIVGGVSRNAIIPFLLKGLQALEYRGYDSAGFAVQHENSLVRQRAVGRVAALAEKSEMALLADAKSFCGIAHTRWATHGVPSERNAHPHHSACDDYEIAVVHNGIIENHEDLRVRLSALGYVFDSDTDTEVIAHLVHAYCKQGQNLKTAVKSARRELKGLYAFAVIDAKEKNYVIATRKGAPLLVGIAEDGYFLASDVSALLPKTNRVAYLNDGDIVELKEDRWLVENLDGVPQARAVVESSVTALSLELGDFSHYMQKEMYEQPDAVADTLALAQALDTNLAVLFGPTARAQLAEAEQVLILACGTSYHAGMIARHWLESIARIPCTVEVASEFRYRNPALRPGTLVVSISQSGETADTRAAVEYAQQQGLANTLSICNVAESSLTRQATLKFLTRAGAEVGVASTKAFSSQLIALYLLTLALLEIKQTADAPAQVTTRLNALREVPHVIQEALALSEPIQRWGQELAEVKSVIFLGRGLLHPIAMEGALKLKEITYIHAEAYSAGELKHGPLALIDESMPVIVSIANDELTDKVKANLAEVAARGGQLYVFANAGCGLAPATNLRVIELPDSLIPELSPLQHVVPLQLLAYYTALAKGTDIDKPRNLAKAVTVE